MPGISEMINEYMQHPAYPLHMPGHKRNAAAAGDRKCAPGDDEKQALSDSYRHDFTEIDGFDVLSHPTGIIRESQERAAKLFGADRTYYLVNGSTVGILAGILAAADPDRKILVGPDCHKSVRHAIELGHLTAVDADGQPLCAGGGPKESKDKGDDTEETGSTNCSKALVSLEDIERELDWDKLPERIEQTLARENAGLYAGVDGQTEGSGKCGQIKGVGLIVITSPTYEGVVSDIARIAETAHRYGALLLVDEAHGSHFGMHPAFPENSNRLGADLVVHSMHKTMSGLTQTALLHVNAGGGSRSHSEGAWSNAADHAKTEDRSSGAYEQICAYEQLCARVEHYLEMLQTSSPSYLLMESIDRCVDLLMREGCPRGGAEGGGETVLHQTTGSERRAAGSLMGDYVQWLLRLREKIRQLNCIGLFETAHSDPGKLILTVKNNEAAFTATDLYTCLRDQYALQLEFAQDGYALAMTSFMDTDEGFDRLYAACARIDEALTAGEFPGKAGEVSTGGQDMTDTVRKTDCYEDGGRM